MEHVLSQQYDKEREKIIPAIVALSQPCNRFPTVAAMAIKTAPSIYPARNRYDYSQQQLSATKSHIKKIKTCIFIKSLTSRQQLKRRRKLNKALTFDGTSNKNISNQLNEQSETTSMAITPKQPDVNTQLARKMALEKSEVSQQNPVINQKHMKES